MGPNTIQLVPLSKKNLYTDIRDIHAEKEKKKTHMRLQSKSGRLQTKMGSQEEPKSAYTLISDFSPQNHKKINFCR